MSHLVNTEKSESHRS